MRNARKTRTPTRGKGEDSPQDAASGSAIGKRRGRVSAASLLYRHEIATAVYHRPCPRGSRLRHDGGEVSCFFRRRCRGASTYLPSPLSQAVEPPAGPLRRRLRPTQVPETRPDSNIDSGLSALCSGPSEQYDSGRNMNRLRRTRLLAPILALALFASMSIAQPAVAFRDRDCSDFSTQAKAQRFYKSHNPQRDPHRLDADRDGIACESLS